MTKFRTRGATEEDLDVLADQRNKMFVDMGRGTEEELKAASRAYRRWAKVRLRNGTLACFISEADGRPVAGGCVWLRETQPGPGHPRGLLPYLLSMYTEPEFRGKGLATDIIKRATAWTKDKGHSRMTLHASTMGKRVYSKLGWKNGREMVIDLDDAQRKPRRKRAKRSA